MRVSLLTDGVFPTIVGGIQKHSYYLAKHLARQDVRVDLYCALPLGLEVEGVPQFGPEARASINVVPVARPQVPYFPGHYVYQSYLTSERLWDAFRRGPAVDFIYAQGFTGWKALQEKRRGAPLPPIGVNFHGLEMYQRTPSLRGRLEQQMLRPFVRYNLTCADVALSLGGGLSHVLRSVGVSPGRIVESPNGVDVHWVAPEIRLRSRPLAFLFVGRYEWRKGVEVLHKAIAALAEKHDFRFHFVGPIPDHLKINSPKVTYWGLLREEEQVKAIFAQCDVLVCPSYAEGMPTVILEAMASGLAIIGTDVGAVDAVVSEANGWVVPPGDGAALQAAMASTLTAPETVLQEKKAQSRSAVQRSFVWEAVAQRTKKGIERVLRDFERVGKAEKDGVCA